MKKKNILFIFCIIFLCFTCVSAREKGNETDDEQQNEKTSEKTEKSNTNDAYEERDGLYRISKFIKKKRINAAYGIIGGHRLELRDLNDHLVPWDFPPVLESYFTFGFGGHIIHNKFILGVEILRFIPKERLTTNEFNTSATATSAMLNFGYLAYSNKGLMAYPIAGIGLGDLRVSVTENNIDSFQDINVLQRSTLSVRKSVVVNFGVGCDYFFNYKKKKKGKNCFMVGFRMGYKMSALKNNWHINGSSITNGPASAFNGPYINVVVGLGGYVEKLIKIAI